MYIAHCLPAEKEEEEDKVEDEAFKKTSLFDMLLYSASVTFFNVSFDGKDSSSFEWKIAHVLQVLASVVLVVLSLAAYLSFKEEMTQDDKDEFLLIKYWESEDEKALSILNQLKARMKQ